MTNDELIAELTSLGMRLGTRIVLFAYVDRNNQLRTLCNQPELAAKFAKRAAESYGSEGEHITILDGPKVN